MPTFTFFMAFERYLSFIAISTVTMHCYIEKLGAEVSLRQQLSIAKR